MPQTDQGRTNRDDQPVLSTKLLAPLIKYYEHEHGGVGLDEALEEAGLTPDLLTCRGSDPHRKAVSEDQPSRH